MNACQYNFFVAVLNQALCLVQNVLRPSALDTASNVRNDAVGTVHVTSIFNLQECLGVACKMAYFKIVNGIFRVSKNKFITPPPSPSCEAHHVPHLLLDTGGLSDNPMTN